MSSFSIAPFLAQVTNAASSAAAGTGTADAIAQPGPPAWTSFVYMILIGGVVYFALIRPQTVARKKQEETLKSAKTGDKVVTSSGIHGLITNVKESTVIVKVADNVKLEIEKTHIEKITRPETADAAKAVAKA